MWHHVTAARLLQGLAMAMPLALARALPARRAPAALRRHAAAAEAPHPCRNARAARRAVRAAAGEQPLADEADPWRGAPPPADAPPPAYGVAAALCAAGAAENAYLTASKLSGAAPALCSAAGAGCAAALGSSYSELFGAPLSAFGAAAYTGVALLALRGALSAPDADSPAAPAAAQPRVALLGGATVLASVSAYLMAILAGPLGGQACPYCILSASLSAATLAAAARGFSARELQRAAAPCVALAAAVVLAVGVPQAQAAARAGADAVTEIPYREPEVSTVATPGARALAAHLGRVGARMYGAFWCSHCAEQKEAFGKGASLPYVECFPDGYRKGIQMAPACVAAKLEGFPTWILADGTKLEGDQTLDKLADLTGYEGGRDFDVASSAAADVAGSALP